MHEKLDWAEHDEEIQEFAKNKIMKYIIDTEFTEKQYPLNFYFNMAKV